MQGILSLGWGVKASRFYNGIRELRIISLISDLASLIKVCNWKLRSETIAKHKYLLAISI